MKLLYLFLLAFLSLFLIRGTLKTTQTKESEKTEYIPFHQVKLTDDFWKKKIDRNQQVTIPHIFEKCEELLLAD